MLRTIEATIDADGNVRLLEPVRLDQWVRALVTILEPLDADLEAEMPSPTEWSEQALAADWLRTDEDAAWAHLQLDR
ncbi:MAG: hypothetical protein IPL60_10895 [Ardenticatenia bacterium]|nr:hypothetical protein [Ardenticatenia bacterium]